MKFKDLPGNQTLKDELREMADNGRIPHALLLAGPPGIGKMMLARTFIQYAQCEHPVDGEPCGTCNSCRMHQDLNHPDLHFSFPIVKSKTLKHFVSDDLREQWLRMLDEAPTMPWEHWLAVSETGNSQPAIHVDEAAEILRQASYPPYAAKTRFFLIWLPERLRVEAANKLLKVVEEPSDGVCFIFVSDNEKDVLPTIFSRTQRLYAKPLGESEIADYLQRRWHLDPMNAAKLARVAAGSLTRADELGSHSGESDEFREMFQSLMRLAYGRKVGDLKRLSEKVAAFGREKIIRFLLYLASMTRENFIYNLRTPQLSCLTPEEEAFSRNFSPFVNAANVEDILAETDRARMETERNVSPKLLLFDYFLLLIPLIRRKPAA